MRSSMRLAQSSRGNLKYDLIRILIASTSSRPISFGAGLQLSVKIFFKCFRQSCEFSDQRYLSKVYCKFYQNKKTSGLIGHKMLFLVDAD